MTAAVASAVEPMAEILAMLRDYQLDVVDRCRKERKAGKRKIILQAETGAGKTRCASFLIWLAHTKGMRALFLADSREIASQSSSEIWGFGVPHGLIMAGAEQDPARTYVAMKQTLVSRCLRRDKFPLPDADLVVVDECHGSLSRDYLELLGHYDKSGATIIGLTATPARQDGRGMGDFYDALVSAVPPSYLIEKGWVLPTKCFAPFTPNMKGVKKSGHDYNPKEAAKKMDRPELVGDAVRHWKLYAEGRQTMVFCCTIDHALNVRGEFRKGGIQAEELDGKTDVVERVALLDKFRAGGFPVLCVVGIGKQGLDIPEVGCIQLLRPTLSYVFFRQAVGRAKRPLAGKEYAILIDHAGACWRHGMPDDDVDWQLDVGSNINKAQAQKNAPKEKKPRCCPKCFALFKEGNLCPNCGHKIVHQREVRHNKAGQLLEVNGLVKADDAQTMERFWHKCLACQAHRGGHVMSAMKMFYNKYRRWPDPKFKNVPSPEHNYTKVAELFPQYIQRKGA